MSLTNGELLSQARMRRLQSSIPSSYTIFKDGATYYAETNIAGGTDYSGTDASAVIQAAYDNLTSGGKILLRNATWTLPTVINIKTNSQISFIGESLGTIIKPDTDHLIFDVDGVNNILFDNLNIQGYQAALGTGHAIAVGIRLGVAALTKYVTVKNCYFTGYLERSIHADPLCQYSIFKDNYMYQLQKSGIAVSGEKQIATGNVIINRTSANGGDNCIEMISATDCIVANNYMELGENGIEVRAAYRNVIEGNKIKNTNSNGICLGLNGITGANNRAYDNVVNANVIVSAGAKGIDIYGENAGNKNFRNIISNNNVTSCGEHGINCLYGTLNVIKGNLIMNNAQTIATSMGIYMDISTENLIEGNFCSDDQAVKTQKYGAGQGDGTAVPNYWYNNYLSGNATGPFSNPYTSKFRDNVGFITENKGTSTGTGAQQTIAHGCNFTPTYDEVFLSERSTGGALPYQSAVPDATNIYVLAVNAKTYNWKVEKA